MTKNPQVVLTGGPGGGKTTFLQELRIIDPLRERFILVPEAATLLIGAGHLPGTKEFQLAVVRLQLALEQNCSDLARPGQVLICDRSVVDSLAYWLLLGGSEEEFFEQIGLSKEDIFSRYAGAIHFRTAARDADRHYLQILEGARVETPEQALEIDLMCEEVWRGCPNFFIVENERGGWQDKAERAKELLLGGMREWRPADFTGKTPSEGDGFS